MDRIRVLPVGWNWHEMYLWLLLNEIRLFFGRTSISVPSGIIEVQNYSLGGHFPKAAFPPWQVRMNNCIFFSQFSLIVRNRYGSARTCPWGYAAKGDCWLCGFDSCYRQSHPQKACCHWNFEARQIHRGYSEDHTSSKTVLCSGWSNRITS